MILTKSDHVVGLIVIFNQGNAGGNLSDPHQVIEEIQRIAAKIISPKDTDLQPSHGVYETEAESLSAISEFVQSHLGDLSKVSADGLKTLLKIARSNVSASHQAQSVLYDLLAKEINFLSPLVRPIYFDMCTSK